MFITLSLTLLVWLWILILINCMCSNLGNNNLSGNLPYSISSMTSLNYLWVALYLKFYSFFLYPVTAWSTFVYLLQKSLVSGILAIIHSLCQLETFWLILLALQPCKISYFVTCSSSLFYYFDVDFLILWISTLWWCNNFIVHFCY